MVAVYASGAVVAPIQTCGFGFVRAMVGLPLITIVMVCGALGQVVVAFVTTTVAVYEPGAAPAGTVITIGVAGNAVAVTSTKPAVLAAALKSIAY